MISARDNKFLKVLPTVVLTPVIEPVIIALDPYFEKAGLTAVVTSGKRDEEGQLRIIREYLKEKGLQAKYPETMTGDVNSKITWEGQEVYSWQPGWSALLNAGIIINPPIRAICLLNYVNSQGVNRKGQFIEASNHIPGKAFNVGGGTNGLNDEVAVIIEAIKHIPQIVSYVVERNNNALHINCKL